MSDILRSLLKLSAVPARFGLIAADAAVTLGKSIVEPRESETHIPAVRFRDVEVDAAAQIIKANMTSGGDTTFQLTRDQLPGRENPRHGRGHLGRSARCSF